MKRGMPSGAQTPDGIIFLLALIFSKAPPRYPPHHGAHWAYTEELEFLWEDSPESAVLRRADTGKWYAVMMRLPKRKFGLADDSISEFILLRIPNEKRDTTLADRRFLSAFHMNKRTWFAIQLDGHMKITEILHLVECSRDQAVKK